MRDSRESKRDEVYRLLADMKIVPGESERKQIENYRFDDNTKITLHPDMIELRTDFDDGQRQVMGIPINGADKRIRPGT
ncbi:MAG: hypothetical protein IJK58_05750 [Clostridia bacterium]|nr:hypothetical protein [Clostridia bacterium]